MSTLISPDVPASSGSATLVELRDRKRLVILVNQITPYRIPLYRLLSQTFDTAIFYSGKETDRACWDGVEENLQGMTVKRTYGFSLTLRYGRNRVFDIRHLHLPFGHISDLWRTRPDAVITVEIGFRTIIALVYSTLARKPLWILWGGTTHTERSVSWLKKLARAGISRWAKRWISYGATSTEYLMTLGIPRERILQIQNCIDESIYIKDIPPLLELQPAPVFLYVGRMIGLKGIDKLLEAAAVLQSQGYRFSLLLVGEGPEQEALEAMSDELGLQNVTFCPAQPPDAMPAVYRSADYLVFPTLGDVWGLVVNEALWSGIPAISSIYAGCATELLPDDQIFNPLDRADFVEVLKRALEGGLRRPDTSRIRTCQEVGKMIGKEISQAIAGTSLK